MLIAAIVLLFTGRYPPALYRFILGMDRWVLRVVAYVGLMTDAYPPFRLDQGGTDPGSLRRWDEPLDRRDPRPARRGSRAIGSDSLGHLTSGPVGPRRSQNRAPWRHLDGTDASAEEDNQPATVPAAKHTTIIGESGDGLFDDVCLHRVRLCVGDIDPVATDQPDP